MSLVSHSRSTKSVTTVQLEGCFIVNKKLRAQMKTIFYMFLLRVLVVVPYTPLYVLLQHCVKQNNSLKSTFGIFSAKWKTF